MESAIGTMGWVLVEDAPGEPCALIYPCELVDIETNNTEAPEWYHVRYFASGANLKHPYLPIKRVDFPSAFHEHLWPFLDDLKRSGKTSTDYLFAMTALYIRQLRDHLSELYAQDVQQRYDFGPNRPYNTRSQWTDEEAKMFTFLEDGSKW